MKDQANKKPLKIRQTSGHQHWLKTSATSGLELVDTDDWDFFIGPQSVGGCSWHPRTLWIGVGCERGTSESLIDRALRQALNEAGLAIEAVAGLTTADRKADEPALLALCQKYDWPLRTYKAEDLTVVSVPTPSQAVYVEMGTASVAEAAALLTVGVSGTLRQSKRIHHAKDSEQGAVTIAIAESALPTAANQGELHLIGSGPGDPVLMSGAASSALKRCTAWVGYELYLDLLEPLRRPDQIRFDGQLTKEWDRCSEALELASQGAKVALISSGDSGIYGMAGLALELWLQKPEATRPHFQVHPGISALQLAAAKTGAPLMHDFCTISLSDRLTPWDVIEQRIQGAGLGDFVIALYNPRSKGRDWQLAKAKKIMLQHRQDTTPVAIARQLGRHNEEIRITTLGGLNPQEIDMLTVLLIGNSSSYSKDGRMVTPRGYPGAKLK
jgi:cobalt-precorrin 5A hydrolase/precorrin-3B C17-methyltransferase